MWYVTDAMEMIMGPYETEEEAIRYLDIFVTECYLLDQFPNPVIEYLQKDEVDGGAVRENIRKKRVEFR